MFNLRNRSLLKEIDVELRELRHVLQLSEAVRVAKYAGTADFLTMHEASGKPYDALT
jgi:ornithine carbamoyltransferase